ncbi:[protein-PII] uridylyltransferase [Sphingomicrobium lutaoense]|uniref:Bifunctional uridylyltransferase/uridylyl-removing enzyme n=1 Tax=Sphingomicrobium lutaoense TaxID=515949 RepID=A0A839Z4S0_9SPHN|nr:[protein-PII] uridylyltransferase [Sphingomicrobium lutaoense]MBB3764635.1 [protein-PII] uridylyltransferase [Sphingomicrobium lutaoense]
MQPLRVGDVDDRRTIIDRRDLADRIAGLPPGPDLRDRAVDLLKQANEAGREEIARRVAEEPYRGRVHAAAYGFLADQLVRLADDFVRQRLYPNANPSSGERIAIAGVGGTGRGEMAPHSDLDLMLIVPQRKLAWNEQVIEALLYILWDLGLTVGQSVRTPSEMLTLSRDDMAIRTAILESRWIWGDEQLYDQSMAAFRRDIVGDSAAEFVAAKMKERDERHERLGDTRYLVEPNVKDGKGGLRDLHTLYWIGKYVFGVRSPAELVDAGLFDAREFRRFERAERFLWSVRCHLHLEAGRAEERLGFDMQRQIAAAMNYSDRPGKSAVERFMQFYFLNAKAVGDLTGVFLAQLDERMAKSGSRFALPTIRRRPRRLEGFQLDRGRLTIPSAQFLREEPVRLIQMFRLAQSEGLEIHPDAMRAAAREARQVDAVRDDPQANALFLEILTGKEGTDTVLRWMNEAGVFGRFVPDFGRVVAQMQFDMYHHYTVDEHTIRAIGLLAAIDRGELKSDHPLATALIKQISSRRTLYVAVLLHDIAKGRGGDHSELGAEIAMRLGPRFGLDEAETETVAWLVRYHLLLSATAFKRDIADPKTIEDFVGRVKSSERLKLLFILTVVDIRAVGPGVWTDWKRTLLKTLYEAAEERLRLGHKQHGRTELVAEKKEALGRKLGWTGDAMRAHGKRLPDSYWLAEPLNWQVANARQMAEAEARIGPVEPSIRLASDKESGATRVSVFAEDRPGLFYRICAALTRAGASIIDARIHTTSDGMALDNLLICDQQGRAYRDRRRKDRLTAALDAVLSDTEVPAPPPFTEMSARDEAFRIAPAAMVAPAASTRFTVIEVHARDRPALLARLAHAIFDSGAIVHSAHVTTYGERAVDTFYLTGQDGRKLSADAAELVRSALLGAARA